MKTIKLQDVKIKADNIQEYIQQLANNHLFFIDEECAKYITVDYNNWISIHERIPTYCKSEDTWYSNGEQHCIGELPNNITFIPEEAIWELDYERI